jgi:uncharacterized RDD family membrane protein YckC
MEERMDAARPLYAGFSRRLAAFLVDAILFLVPGLFFYGVLVFRESDLAWLAGAMFAAAWIYSVGFHVSPLQATLGKANFGIKVTDLRGERIGVWQASRRFFAAWLSVLPLMLGFHRIHGSPERQALHDRLAGTLVVRRDASPADVLAGGGAMEIGDSGGFAFAATLVVLLLIPSCAVSINAYHSMGTRTKVYSATIDANAVKPEVERWIAEGRLPARGERRALALVSPHVASLSVDHSGRITLAIQGLVPSANGRIHLTPRTKPDGRIEWACTSEGVRAGFLPPPCRP